MVAQPGRAIEPVRLHRPPAAPPQLPAQPTPLIGRDTEVAALRDRLLEPDVRLLTLTGPPGTGKTRLALAAAAALIDDFDDGVWFVPLEAVREPDGVVVAIARALGVPEAAGQPPGATVAAALADRRLLLVLDNFEQVLAAAVQVAALLGACPHLKMLVTSRAPLRLRWEHEYQVGPLTLPEATGEAETGAILQAPSVQLFLARARSALPDFRVTSADAAAVAAICAKLDGLPLAIELAAARVSLLSLDAILDRLTRRLTLLTSGPRDLPDRHRTLRAALAWSYDLLAPEERSAFRSLAAFAGGCTVEAAAAVIGVAGSSEPETDARVLDVLDALLGQSLLRRERPAGGEPRLRLLETVREFAREQLEAHDELEAASDRHAAHFLALAEAAAAHLAGAEQAPWLARLEAEHDNVRAALAWLLARGAGEPALRLSRAMWRFWYLRGHLSEGRRWLERALAVDVAPSRSRALALQALASLAWSQGDFATARARAEESIALLREPGDRGEIAIALNTLGAIAIRRYDYPRAREHFAAFLAIVREQGDTWRTAIALYNLGIVSTDLGDYPAARSYLEESLAVRRALGDTAGIAASLDSLGLLANRSGDPATARTLCGEGLALRRALGDTRAAVYSLCNLASAERTLGDLAAARALVEEGLALARQAGDGFGIAWTLAFLGSVARVQGEDVVARASWEQSLAMSHEQGVARVVATCLAGLAGLAAERGQPARAARLLGATRALRDAIGAAVLAPEREEYAAAETAARAALGERAFTAALAAGRAMPLEAAVAAALCGSDEGGVVNDESASFAGNSSFVAPPSSIPRGLTGREAEVLRLIAAGHSNPAIAAALVLSIHTVERHAANIYAKIGARGRADAIAFALRHGLSPA